MAKPENAAARARAAVGQRVRELRRQAGVTLEGLAEQAGVHPNSLGTIERGLGNPSLDVLTRVADALGVDVASLLDLRETDTQAELRRAVRDRVALMDEHELRRLLRVLDALR